MSRPLRIESKDATCHIMNRGRRHEEVFFDDGDRYMFLNGGLFVRTVEETVKFFLKYYKLTIDEYNKKQKEFYETFTEKALELITKLEKSTEEEMNKAFSDIIKYTLDEIKGKPNNWKN